ncbi:MAG: SlyX family protein [Pseudomonadota bacterium]
MSTAPSGQRITALEEEISHLTRVNEELSDEISSQWKRIDVLEKAVKQFKLRLDAVEGGEGILSENTKPPHW